MADLPMTVLRIPARTESPTLDPVTVYIEHVREEAAQVVIVCYDQAWVCFWGAMGCGPVEFLAGCGADYVTDRMMQGRVRPARHEHGYAGRVAKSVIEHCQQLVKGVGDA